jgi:hypothetical protein
MSMPDALLTEIALIALLLFKLQVYSTPLHHYYHCPITLSTFQLLHQSTIHHMASPPLIALIRLRQQPWQLMQLDIATPLALGMLAIGAT